MLHVQFHFRFELVFAGGSTRTALICRIYSYDFVHRVPTSALFSSDFEPCSWSRMQLIDFLQHAIDRFHLLCALPSSNRFAIRCKFIQSHSSNKRRRKKKNTKTKVHHWAPNPIDCKSDELRCNDEVSEIEFTFASCFTDFDLNSIYNVMYAHRTLHMLIWSALVICATPHRIASIRIQCINAMEKKNVYNRWKIGKWSRWKTTKALFRNTYGVFAVQKNPNCKFSYMLCSITVDFVCKWPIKRKSNHFNINANK